MQTTTQAEKEIIVLLFVKNVLKWILFCIFFIFSSSIPSSVLLFNTSGVISYDITKFRASNIPNKKNVAKYPQNE